MKIVSFEPIFYHKSRNTISLDVKPEQLNRVDTWLSSQDQAHVHIIQRTD